MLRDPQEFIKCTNCNETGLISNFPYHGDEDCGLCDGSGEIHPSDDDEEPDGDFKFDEERDRGL